MRFNPDPKSIKKDKTCSNCGKPKKLFARGMCQQCDKIVGAKLKKQAKASEGIGINDLEEQLDDVFSIYIRRRFADNKGIVKCFTSDREMHWTQAHAGHFISRKHLATRWDEINVQVQSENDNVYKGGNLKEFERRLVAQYGIEAVEKLKEMRYQTTKLSANDYEEKILYYKQKIKKLEQ